MKPGTNGRRPRGRPNRKQHGGQARPNNFDSGQEGRVRGNAHQVYERYLALARDAVTAGDRIASETYYQHAEHYFRVLNSSTDPQPNGQSRHDRHGGDNRHEGGSPEAGPPEGGRPREQRAEARRPETARPEVQESSPIQAGGGPQPTPPMTMAPAAPMPMAATREPATNGQDQPHSDRPPHQGGRHRRSPPNRNAPARPLMAREGSPYEDDAPPAHSSAQPEPRPLPKAQPGAPANAGCEPISD